MSLTSPGNVEDYDLRLYRKLGDGSLDPVGNGVGGFVPPEVPVFGGTQLFNGSPGSSGNPPGFAEAIEVLDPPVGTYVARVVNYAATGQTWELTAERLYKAPDVFTDLGKREAWTLSCESADGKTVYETRSVEIERGERQSLSLACGGKKSKKGKTKAQRIKAARKKHAACVHNAKKIERAKKRKAAVKSCKRTYRRKVRRIRASD